MASSPIFSSMSLFFLLLLQVTTSKTASLKVCPIRKCSPTGPEIRFPFQIREFQDEHCGYEEFEVSCDDRNRTILHLSDAGDFVVGAIEYDDQYILVEDANDCLPKRLLENQFANSYLPFLVQVYNNFTFANCSSAYYSTIGPESGVVRVECLSLGRHTVVTSDRDDNFTRLWMSQLRCHERTVSVPWRWQHPTNISESIWLTWDQPDCKLCEAADGRCVLKDSKSGLKLVCIPKHGFSQAAQFAIASVFMLPWLTCIFGFIWFVKVRVCGRRDLNQISSTSNPDSAPSNNVNREAVVVGRHNDIGAMGIDSPTIESYPKTQINDLGQLPWPNDDVCAICLSKYERKEMIRTIPECEHYFHAYCIDQWLRKNASCPLCRNYQGYTNTNVTSN